MPYIEESENEVHNLFFETVGSERLYERNKIQCPHIATAHIHPVRIAVPTAVLILTARIAAHRITEAAVGASEA